MKIENERLIICINVIFPEPLGGGLHRLGVHARGQVPGGLRPSGRRGRSALGAAGGGGCLLGRS